MPAQNKQQRILALFEHLTSMTRAKLPVDERDPRLKRLGRLPRGVLFSSFHPVHTEEARDLYEVLYKSKDFEDFMHLAEQARDIVNEGLLVHALDVAILHRDDFHGISPPSIQEIFPDWFIPAETINQALKADLNRGDQESVVVDIQQTGNILDPEFKLSYFREDIGANAHHYHWHNVYPATWRPEVMGQTKDRQGELFFYMHQQMCARYDCDRFSTGLQRMIPFQNFEETLEGYSPHLTTLVSGLHYAPRPSGLVMHDLPGTVDVQDMFRWSERILRSIHIGHLTDNHGDEIPLDIEHGIDMLAAVMESNASSINPDYYGNLHNLGHVIIARAHDPDGRFKENPGVMDSTATSIRDPIFFRYHRYLDNVFQEYKATLPPYKKTDIEFPGVHVVNVTVQCKVPNVVTTFMKQANLELSHGVQLKGSVKVNYYHLDHDEFSYSISAENQTNDTKHATVRIFLAPKFDELGNALQPNEQRRFCIEMDKFTAELTPGKNTITRKSSDSSVTVKPYPTFEELREQEGDHKEACSCGWPQHLLVPKGTNKGMDFKLFVLLTDHDHDRVNGLEATSGCADAVSYCGAKYQKYPDKKAMGFPFDRVIKANTIDEFITDNMSVTDIKIQFKEHA